MPERPCFCGTTTQVRVFKDGPRCPAHTPAALAGNPEPPVPDPALTFAGLRAAAGADPTKTITPHGVTAIDTARIAKGKVRSTQDGYRAVIQQREDSRRRNLHAVPPAPEAVTPPPPPHSPAGGLTASPLDTDRLSAQSRRVWDVMLDGKWRTLRELADAADAPEASVSARFREFRSEEFGSQPLDAERIDGTSLWRYRLDLSRLAQQQPA